MANTTILEKSLHFLKNLSGNNNREWFADHKDEYLKGQENIIAFADALLAEMNKHDHIETASGKKSLHRIYRDVRFSKEKVPYNTYWGGGFSRATKQLRGGYYFHLEPGNSFVAGGFWGPNADDLKRIRLDIDVNYDELQALLADKTFVKTFGKLLGEQVSYAPRGYDKEHPGIELLRYKQYLLKHHFTDEEVLSADFVVKANDVFKKMRPFFNYMSDVLTTDVNGELLK